MLEKIVNVNDVDIAYQLHGNNSHPTILLIHGLSTPLVGWPTELIDHLIEAQFQVLLIDNRDIGRSQLLDHLAQPSIIMAFLKLKMGLAFKSPYQLTDMAQDVSALLKKLEIKEVHVVGASMGGMIAQLLAIHHGDQIKSLTSIMSTTGNRKLPTTDKSIRSVLISQPKSNQDADLLTHHIAKWRAIQSPSYPATEPYLQGYVERILQRGTTKKGSMRQLLAILSAENREPALAKISIPSLIIHGDSDKLVHVAGGKATAKAIPNSKLKIYPGMGHDLPIELIPCIGDEIIQHVRDNSK